MLADRVTISIVSHGHAALVEALMRDLAHYCAADIEVILTLNIEEELPINVREVGYPVTLIQNERPKGFGANHNAAFKLAKGSYFCILNPDIRLECNPLPTLVSALDDSRIGVVAPKILGPSKKVEDSARRFPTLTAIVSKALLGSGRLDYDIAEAPISPDWVAGMFMVFRSESFSGVGGFDERYFLYYEDVDLCFRLRQAGQEVLLLPQVSAIHHARRQSHRKARYLLWHVLSLLRFLNKRLRCEAFGNGAARRSGRPQ